MYPEIFESEGAKILRRAPTNSFTMVELEDSSAYVPETCRDEFQAIRIT